MLICSACTEISLVASDTFQTAVFRKHLERTRRLGWERHHHVERGEAGGHC